MSTHASLDDRLPQIVSSLVPMEPVRITLFGSAARGEADEHSDIDLVVVAERVAPRFLDRIADAYDLIQPDYAIDILIYTPDEYAKMLVADNALLELVEAEGRTIYERSAA